MQGPRNRTSTNDRINLDVWLDIFWIMAADHRATRVGAVTKCREDPGGFLQTISTRNQLCEKFEVCNDTCSLKIGAIIFARNRRPTTGQHRKDPDGKPDNLSARETADYFKNSL